MFYCLKWEMHYIFERQPKELPTAIIADVGVISPACNPTKLELAVAGLATSQKGALKRTAGIL